MLSNVRSACWSELPRDSTGAYLSTFAIDALFRRKMTNGKKKKGVPSKARGVFQRGLEGKLKSKKCSEWPRGTVTPSLQRSMNMSLYE